MSTGEEADHMDWGTSNRLHKAIKMGDRHIFKTLLEEGPNVNVNVKDNYESTPLHDVASRGDAELVKMLLDKHADVWAEDLSGRKPVDMIPADSHLVEQLLTAAMKERRRHPKKKWGGEPHSKGSVKSQREIG